MRLGGPVASALVAALAVACSSRPVAPPPARASHVAVAPDTTPPTYGAEQILELARRKDPRTVEICVESLRDSSESVQAAAAIALADLGRPLAEPARPALLRALELAGPNAGPQIAWALLALGETKAFDRILGLLQGGTLARVVGLDGKPAFDAHSVVKLAGEVTLDKSGREKYLQALRAGAGTPGLMIELSTIKESDPKLDWFGKKKIFDLIEQSNDPRGADALAAFIDGKPHVHLETRAAFALARIGDLRALPALARRLRMDPSKVYSDAFDWEMMLKRDDNERITAARHVADLARLHPEAHALIRERVEDAILSWIDERPSPHANGLRALAHVGSTKILPRLRKWANPRQLPKPDQQPPMPEDWIIAQVALRYVGVAKDEKSWPLLERALGLRPKALDVTMDGLMQGGMALLGMALRAAGVGASDGFAEWGDPRAFRPLIDYIDERLNNEQSRLQACTALPWVAAKAEFSEIARRAVGYAKNDKSDEFRRECLLQALQVRPGTGVARQLLPLLEPASSYQTKLSAARAMAKSGLDPALEATLFDHLKNDDSVVPPALSLMLGGTAKTAARAVERVAEKSLSDLEELGEVWFRSFDLWTDEDLTSGVMFRYVDNADAIANLTIEGKNQSFARAMLMKQLANLQFDNGPHSLTRVVLRGRLRQLALSADGKQSAGAIAMLRFMNEGGTLLALSDERGPIGELAHAALLELLSEPPFSAQD